MADVLADGGDRAQARNSLAARIANAALAAGPPLLFGLRLWASVCLALYVAFWLQLDNPSWAGTSAAIVCQPQLGASLRKGWYRLVGTLIGAVAIVVLTAFFPQDRAAYLLTLMLWGAACALGAALLRNFASYSAALAGYTAAIIASDTLGATGGPSGDVFLTAVTRASEICIGIVSAGIVLAGTDLGSARHNLAALFAGLIGDISAGFTGELAQPVPEEQTSQPLRREFLRRVIALTPVVDQAIGESSELRFRSPVLQAASDGLVDALAGWRAVAVHLSQRPVATARNEADRLLRHIPAELRPPPGRAGDPVRLHAVAEAAAQRLLAAPGGTPSLRLLADQTARVFAGLSEALAGLALLTSGVTPRAVRQRNAGFHVPDWLPPLITAARAFIAIGVAALFWIVTAWPSGTLAMTFAAIIVLLFGPLGEQVYATTGKFMIGSMLGAALTAILKFAVLPGLETFPAFCIVLGLYLIPVSALLAWPWQPVIATGMIIIFIPLLAPTNQMTFDTVEFYNTALAILAGSAAGALAFRLLPPLSPAFATHRLLALTLGDLRRLAAAPLRMTTDHWEGRIYGRLVAMPDSATPLQRAQILAALFIGTEILQLCRMGAKLGLTADLSAAFGALAQGNSAAASARLAAIGGRLASLPQERPEASAALDMRAGLLAVLEVLAQHGSYFDGRTLT